MDKQRGGNVIDHNDLRNILRHRVEAAGGGSAFAKEAGVSPTLISLTLSGRQKVGPMLAEKIGYRKIVGFVPLQSDNKGA